jgi:hypothetical protein
VLAPAKATIWMDAAARRLDHRGVSNTRRQFMGDKSPKAKEKAKKQDTLDKNQKKATAATKASQQGSAGAAKKGR